MSPPAADQLCQFWCRCRLPRPAWPAASTKYQRYWELIQVHNASAALMASATSTDLFYLKHLADSLAVLLAWPRLLVGPTHLADVGSGAGLPGVALAVALPSLRLTAIESNQKKAAFLALAIRELALTDRADVLPSRSRQLGHDPNHRHSFNVVAARAVAPAEKLIRDVRGLLAPGGSAIFYKTPRGIADELPLAQREADKHKLTIEISEAIDLPAGAGSRQFMRVIAPQ